MLLRGLAEEIADDLLYRTGQAMSSGNGDQFSECFSVPHMMETPEGARVLASEDAIRSVYDCVRSYYDLNGVTEVVRTVLSAEFLGPDLVGAMYVTRLIQEGQTPFRNPYPMYSILRRLDGAWRVTTCSYAILDSPEHNRALLADRPRRRNPSRVQTRDSSQN